VADKNFKVKSGLQVPSLTTAGPVTTDSAGNVTSSATLPITQGGTGQTTAGNALNALLPLQTSQDNKFLQTNGVSTQWTIPQQQTSTDGTLGYKVYSGTVTPTSPVTGDIWIDQTTGNGIQLVRWRKTVASTTTTVTGLDDNNLTLSYTAGNEQVYINGTLITRGQDYTATNGTSIVLVQAAEVGDTVEIFGNPLFSVTDTYTQAQSNSLYVSKTGFDAAGKNYCINGGMDIWQRGTSFTNSGGGVYTADRWQSFNVSGTFTVARTTSNIPANFNYGAVVTATSNSTTAYLMHLVETQNTLMLMGKNIIMGAWVQAPAGTTINIQVLSSTTVDASIYNFNGNVTGTSSFVATGSPQFVFTSSGIMASNVKTLRCDVWVSSLSNGQSYTVTGVQLEAGSIPTPFSRAGVNIQGETAACQRYFVRYTPNSTIGNTMYFASGNAISTTRAMVSLNLPVNLRTTPSITRTSGVALYNQGSNYYWNSSAPLSAVYQMSQNILNLDCWVPSGLTNNTSVMISLVGASDYLDFSAEL
jgi:hypothetical protein